MSVFGGTASIAGSRTSIQVTAASMPRGIGSSFGGGRARGSKSAVCIGAHVVGKRTAAQHLRKAFAKKNAEQEEAKNVKLGDVMACAICEVTSDVGVKWGATKTIKNKGVSHEQAIMNKCYKCCAANAELLPWMSTEDIQNECKAVPGFQDEITESDKYREDPDLEKDFTLEAVNEQIISGAVIERVGRYLTAKEVITKFGQEGEALELYPVTIKPSSDCDPQCLADGFMLPDTPALQTFPIIRVFIKCQCAHTVQVMVPEKMRMPSQGVRQYKRTNDERAARTGSDAFWKADYTLEDIEARVRILIKSTAQVLASTSSAVQRAAAAVEDAGEGGEGKEENEEGDVQMASGPVDARARKRIAEQDQLVKKYSDKNLMTPSASKRQRRSVSQSGDATSADNQDGSQKARTDAEGEEDFVQNEKVKKWIEKTSWVVVMEDAVATGNEVHQLELCKAKWEAVLTPSACQIAELQAMVTHLNGVYLARKFKPSEVLTIKPETFQEGVKKFGPHFAWPLTVKEAIYYRELCRLRAEVVCLQPSLAALNAYFQVNLPLDSRTEPAKFDPCNPMMCMLGYNDTAQLKGVKKEIVFEVFVIMLGNETWRGEPLMKVAERLIAIWGDSCGALSLVMYEAVSQLMACSRGIVKLIQAVLGKQPELESDDFQDLKFLQRDDHKQNSIADVMSRAVLEIRSYEKQLATMLECEAGITAAAPIFDAYAQELKKLRLSPQELRLESLNMFEACSNKIIYYQDKLPEWAIRDVKEGLKEKALTTANVVIKFFTKPPPGQRMSSIICGDIALKDLGKVQKMFSAVSTAYPLESKFEISMSSVGALIQESLAGVRAAGAEALIDSFDADGIVAMVKSSDAVQAKIAEFDGVADVKLNSQYLGKATNLAVLLLSTWGLEDVQDDSVIALAQKVDGLFGSTCKQGIDLYKCWVGLKEETAKLEFRGTPDELAKKDAAKSKSDVSKRLRQLALCTLQKQEKRSKDQQASKIPIPSSLFEDLAAAMKLVDDIADAKIRLTTTKIQELQKKIADATWAAWSLDVGAKVAFSVAQEAATQKLTGTDRSEIDGIANDLNAAIDEFTSIGRNFDREVPNEDSISASANESIQKVLAILFEFDFFEAFNTAVKANIRVNVVKAQETAKSYGLDWTGVHPVVRKNGQSFLSFRS